MNDHIYLAHHGIKGQKWGVRRFQNEDGSLTSAGKKRYGAVGEAATKADKFAQYARENAEKFSKSKRTAKDARISERQAKRYEVLAKRYMDMSKDVSQISKKDLKEAKRFVEQAFFTDSDYAWYYSGGKWHNTEDHD